MEDNTEEIDQEKEEFTSHAEAAADIKSNAQSVDESYIHVFLLKYICPAPECGGTMAPLPGANKSQCNMCDRIRTEQEFMEEMNQFC